jgi:MoaA/NifB/PqqE/SkfB family radical SAM enzyme
MFWDELEKELPNIKQIDMYGGEPMLVKKQWETLKKSIELGYAKDQELSFNTNGTIFKEEYIDILKEFKRVVISFSLDATKERFNYIRHHGDWENVVKNIKNWLKYKSDKLYFDVAVTVTNLNLYYLDELVDWCIEMNLNPYFIDVSHPDFYSPSNLPTSAKNSINKKFDIYLYKEHIPPHIVDGIRGSLQNMNSTEFNDLVWYKFIKNNKFLDESRNQSFEKTFEELNSVI